MAIETLHPPNPADFRLWASWGGVLFLDAHAWQARDSSAAFKELTGLDRETVTLNANATEYLYMTSAFNEAFGAWLALQIDQTPHALVALLESFLAQAREAREAHAALSSVDWASLDNASLARTFRDSFRRIQRLSAYNTLAMLCDPVLVPALERYVRSELDRLGRPGDFARVLELAATPRMTSTTQQEAVAVLELALEVLDARRAERLEWSVPQALEACRSELDDLAARFGWMPVFQFNSAWSAADYADELCARLSEGRVALERRQSDFRSLATRVEDKYATLARGFAPSVLPTLMQLFVHVRNEEEFILGYGHFQLASCFAQIASRLGLTLVQLRYLTPDEVVDALNGQPLPVTQIERRRSMGTAVHSTATQERVLSCEEAAAFHAFHQRAAVPVASAPVIGRDVFRGVPASAGKAIGPVRVVLNPSQIHTFQKGEVLVAVSTTPDYIPAMKKAAAFVTELGGVTNHAAVVAREFGLPCIVGVRNATTIFQNGQIIAVDADAGVISLTEKNQNDTT